MSTEHVALGDIVLYVPNPIPTFIDMTPDLTYKAAIVSHVYYDDVVRLHVLEESGLSVIQQVGYSAEKVGHSWHKRGQA